MTDLIEIATRDLYDVAFYEDTSGYVVAFGLDRYGQSVAVAIHKGILTVVQSGEQFTVMTQVHLN